MEEDKEFLNLKLEIIGAVHNSNNIKELKKEIKYYNKYFKK